MTGARALLLAACVGAALGLVLGAAVGVRLAPDAPAPRVAAPTGNEPATRDARIAALEAEVARWRGAYEELEREKTPAADTTAEQAPVAAAPVQEHPGPVRGQPLDAPGLQARGYTEDEVRRLQERYEAYELALLYLNDRARRESWRGSPRFTLEQQRLTEALQTDLGERDYDAVLWGSGQSNRVQVAGVLSGSAAERAGLRDGDEVYSYDGRRIFEAQTLLRSTVEGNPGAQTSMIVRRNGEEVHVVLPRGPIGIRLTPLRVPPDGFL
jgi:hypothetical protein